MARESIDERRVRLTPGAEWLRSERERRGLSGSELANRLGIWQTRLSAYERAQDEPPADFARSLAREFDLSELEVWHGLRKPLPREIDLAAMSDKEVVAEMERRFPGRLDQIMRGEVDTKSRKRADDGRPGENGLSA